MTEIPVPHTPKAVLSSHCAYIALINTNSFQAQISKEDSSGGMDRKFSLQELNRFNVGNQVLKEVTNNGNPRRIDWELTCFHYRILAKMLNLNPPPLYHAQEAKFCTV